MTHELEDQRFSTLFHELRAVDEQSASPFSGLVDSVESRTPEYRARRRGLRVIAAVAAPGVAVALLILSQTTTFAPQEPTAVGLLQWRSPTDGLLKVLTNELTSGVPRVGDSLREITTDLKE